AVLMMLVNGKILGVSGIVGGLISPGVPDRLNRVAFFAGALVIGVAAARFFPTLNPGALTNNPVTLLTAGLAVGFGTRLGSGCTSGHGVCGIARLSPRSVAATGIFMAVAMATVFVVRHV
ncbi:MAG: YeeE/YedE thiosulfate transporter family protein, partial [Pseudomonadota bacterium]